MNIFLQAKPIPQLDTLDIKSKVEEAVDIISTTPADELISGLLEKGLSLGLKVVAAILLYIVGAWLIKRIRKILNNLFIKRNTDKAIASFVGSLVSISLTVLLIIIVIGTLGINTTSLAALLAAGGMAFGMALSGTVQNFAGGIMLIIFKPIHVGDFIVVQGYSGTVTEINIVNTKLTTTDNRVIFIQNGALFGGTIDNYSRNQMRRLEWLVDVSYGSSSADTKDVLNEIMVSDKRILNMEQGAPANPLVELNSLKDSSVQFIMRAWVKLDDYWDVNWSVNERIYNELPKKGISFPFPQLDVHISNVQKS